MSPRLIDSLALAGLLAMLAMAGAADAAPAGGFYCCTAPDGKQVCGDILPQVCYGRAYRELGADGRTIREIDAPLTAEQRAKKAAEEEKRKEDEIRMKEQQRKDQALLDTYASVNDIEAMRKRALDDVNKSIKSAEKRIGEIKTQRKKYENEAEFYKKKKMPAEVEKGLTDTAFEIKAQESIIEAKKKEIEAIQAKYDEDRARYVDLQRRRPGR